MVSTFFPLGIKIRIRIWGFVSVFIIMRQPADWMRPTDDRLLEFLESEGPDLPSNMSDVVGVHRKYAGERCRQLAKYGLLTNKGGGLYEITNEGRAYLAGDLDASELDAED